MPERSSTGAQTASPEYEDYHETSKSYDETRHPVAVEVVLGCFAMASRPLHEQIILDGGCGTGNYIAAVKDKVGTVHGIDMNGGMLAQSRTKVDAAAEVCLLQASLTHLPYRDAMFDGMMCNQVIHHLNPGDQAEPFRELRLLMAEAYRVLRPEGVIVFNTSTAQQLREGFWWADLIPEAVNQIIPRFPPLDNMRSMLEAVGFDFGGIIVPLHEVLQGKQYLAPYGPLKKMYRDGDSTWSLASEEELQHALSRFQAMHDSGRVTAYLQQREQLRHQVGQNTCVFARK